MNCPNLAKLLPQFVMENPVNTSAGLRERADWARRHARSLWPHAAAEQLLAYAKVLDERATALDQAREGAPAQVERC